MTRYWITGLALVALVGCAGDPRQTSLTPDLLEDQKTLSGISNRLDPTDRADFNRYVLNRTVGSRIFPGQAAVMPSGKDPATVGEAISLMRAIEKRNAAVHEIEKKRDVEMQAASADMERIGASDISRYNAAVGRYNAVIESYGEQIKAAQAKPLQLETP